MTEDISGTTRIHGAPPAGGAGRQVWTERDGGWAPTGAHGSRWDRGEGNGLTARGGSIVETMHERNVSARQRMRAHHAAMVAQVRARVQALAEAAVPAWPAARDALAAHVRGEVLPHAQAEESTVYRTAREHRQLGGLIDAMVLEHAAIARLLEALARAASAGEALAIAGGIEHVFATHAGIENEVILAVLEADAQVDLAQILGSMHAALGATAGTPGDVDLDVRAVPHAQRHTLILGRLERLEPGQALVISVDHDPLPLRRHLEAVYGDRLEWTYRLRGPEDWRVGIRRRD